MTLLIRAVQRSDFAAWKPLWDGYNAIYGRKDETGLPDRITEMTWSRFFDGYEPVNALVAEQAGQLLGLAHFLFHRSTISVEPVCYLQDLFTVETGERQRRGARLDSESLSMRQGSRMQPGLLAHS